jgi:hypothetical protein
VTGNTLTLSNDLTAALAATSVTIGTANLGFTISFNGDVSATSATDYQIWYSEGVLTIWDTGTLVYSNQTNAAVDTGDISITEGIVAGNASRCGSRYDVVPPPAEHIYISRAGPWGAGDASEMAGFKHPDWTNSGHPDGPL